MPEPVRIALIGDLHGYWDDWDARYFAASAYDLCIFTGDLGSGTRQDGVRIARSVGRLAKRALVMPGNNDAEQAPEIFAELSHQRGLRALLGGARAQTSASHVQTCGYSVHPYEVHGRAFTVVAARPFAMGGNALSFPERLAETHGVHSMKASVERLCALVDDAPTDELVFLGHNGPSGLGARACDLWGCDFRASEGDHGDDDLAAAIAHARARGKRVLAVVAGHMHSPARNGKTRVFSASEGGTLYVNPARVPRMFHEEGAMRRHHAVLELRDDGAHAYELVVEDDA